MGLTSTRSSGRWLRGIAVVFTAASVIVAGPRALADPAPDAPAETAPTVATGPADPQYLLQNMATLLMGYQRDLPNPAEQQYWWQQLATLPGRAGVNLATMLDPAQYQGADGQDRLRDTLQKLIDMTVHQIPTIAGAGLLPVNRLFVPNWSHNGQWGSPEDNALEIDSPAHSAGNVGLTAQFRYPCVRAEGDVWYQNEDGVCVPGDTPGAVFKTGTARKVQIIDSRGLRMAATLWYPEGALDPGNTKKYPMTVFTNGAAVAQSAYYAWTETAVTRGYIGLTYDEAGQGASDGTVLDQEIPFNVPYCASSGICRDVEDVMRWVFNDDIGNAPTTESFLGDTSDPVNFWNTVHIPRIGKLHDPAYAPEGDNIRNPALDIVDLDRVGVWSQSQGSLGLTHYLKDVGEGKGMDGRPLPKPAAAVVMSALSPVFNSIVPTQIQTADIDIPGMTIAGITGLNNFNFGGANIGLNLTDGPLGDKAWYDWLRRHGSGNAALQTLTLLGGSHGDTANIDFIVPQATYSVAISVNYAVDWMDCHVQQDDSACGRVTQADPHLSKSVASEIAPDGTAGPSYCMNTPTEQSLETAAFGPIKDLLNKIYGEEPPAPCVPASGDIPLHP